jgi:hypothetical protein
VSEARGRVVWCVGTQQQRLTPQARTRGCASRKPSATATHAQTCAAQSSDGTGIVHVRGDLASFKGVYREHTQGSATAWKHTHHITPAVKHWCNRSRVQRARRRHPECDCIRHLRAGFQQGVHSCRSYLECSSSSGSGGAQAAAVTAATAATAEV